MKRFPEDSARFLYFFPRRREFAGKSEKSLTAHVKANPLLRVPLLPEDPTDRSCSSRPLEPRMKLAILDPVFTPLLPQGPPALSGKASRAAEVAVLLANVPFLAPLQIPLLSRQ